jgi:hypothetical protein
LIDLRAGFGAVVIGGLAPKLHISLGTSALQARLWRVRILAFMEWFCGRKGGDISSGLCFVND